jgi:hypothetical protein
VRIRRIAALVVTLVLAACAAAAAQTPAKKPRRHFVSVSLDIFGTQPLHFANWPVEELVGREVTEAQGEPYDYRSRDGATTVDVRQFRNRERLRRDGLPVRAVVEAALEPD